MWPFASRTPAPKPIEHHVHITHHGTLLPGEWRDSPERVKWAADLFRTRLGADLLAVLRNASPRISPNGTIEQAAIAGAMVAGYQQCLDTLLNLAEPKVVPTELPPATYSTPSGPSQEDAAAAQADAWEAVESPADLT